MKNIAILFAGLLLAATSASAHHSSAGRYDSRSLTEIEGVITAIRWRNPHAHLMVLVTDENGQEIEWEVEGAGVTTLARSGLRESLFQVGDRVRVAGWSPVTARREMFMQNVLLSSGEEFVTWPSASVRWSEESRGDFAFWSQNEGDRSRPEAGIFRVWSSSFALPGLFNLSRLDTNAFPLTEAGLARVEAFEARGENLVSTQGCTPKGMPLIMEQPYPMEFVRAGDDIELHIEEYDAVRRIRMGVDASAGENVPPGPFGFSTGRWERDTLVVTTTRLNWPLLNQSGAPLSEEVVLEERFTPLEQGSLLDYQLTVTDPLMYTAPVERGKQWLYLPGQEVRPYDCTESL